MDGDNHERLIYGDRMGPLGKRKPITVADFQAKNHKVEKGRFTLPSNCDAPIHVDMFVPRDPKLHSGIVISLCWEMLKIVDNKYQAAAYLASALSQFSPDLEKILVPQMESRGVIITTISIPDEALDAGYDYRALGHLYPIEVTYIFCAVALIIFFKHVRPVSYDGFIKARLRALGGIMFLMSDEQANLEFPLDMERARMIQSVFSNISVKRGILRWVMWASETESDITSIARYVGSILAWSELNLLVFINNTFVKSQSPVMRDPRIQDEVHNYTLAMAAINSSSSPKYFWYFCTRDQEQLIRRQNFITLCAVAQQLLKEKSKSKSKDQFQATAKDSDLVSELVQSHKEFCRDNLIATTKSWELKFLFAEIDYSTLFDRQE
ncbi:hypothetical protein OROGR_019456 [Orobanche gracilis]